LSPEIFLRKEPHSACFGLASLKTFPGKKINGSITVYEEPLVGRL